MKKYIFVLSALAFMLFACEEQPVGSTPMDGVAPGMVTEVGYNSVPGGADIFYTLPDDEDLLYVKANYTLANGKKINTRVSMYDDTLRVRGYADTDPRIIDIVTGDRSGNESEPVQITITPKPSPIYDILESVAVNPTFGGVTLTWENPTESVIAVTLKRSVAGGDWEEVNTYYSNSKTAKYSARGMEVADTKFGVAISDRWDNATNERRFNATPWYEEQLKAGTYKEYKMSSDSEIAYGWALNYALNGDLTEPWGWFSKPTVEGGNWPARFTMQFNTKVSLSRMKLVQRHGEMWENGNPKCFSVYGSNNPVDDTNDPAWVLLKDFTSVKPSGLPSGQYSDEDAYVAQNGEDFEFDPDKIDSYKYYRFEFTENWGGDNTFINFFELLFWGQNK